MRQLLSSLGDRYGQRKKYAVAELCFEKAIAISPYDPDPAAIRNLVNLYAEQGQGQKIDEIATRYEFNLFESKGRAYRDSDLEKIYQYHRTLGQIYGYLAEKSGNWGDRRTPKSAIFQLEHAMRVGRELDQMLARDTEKHLYHIDPGLVDLLATAYAATGSAVSSTSLRLDAARQYERAGDERARDYVLKPIRSEDLTPDQTREYRSLMRSRGA
jgi:tetratricopeptide (TPR) repeat protein